MIERSACALAVLTAILSLPMSAPAQTAVFSPIEAPSPGAHTYYGMSVSADGKVVAGYAADYSTDQAFRWTKLGGYQDLGSMPGFADGDQAHGISADGSAIVGWAKSSGKRRAFRWTAGSGMVDLGNPGPDYSSNEARGISADGKVIVGVSAFSPTATTLAFRRTASGTMQNLGDLIPEFDVDSVGHDVSVDGGVVIGQATRKGGVYTAFRWQNGAMQSLGTLGSEYSASYAFGVSADGSVVVGSTNMPDFTTQAFRWTADGMVVLPPLDAGLEQSVAYAVTANGRMIVGRSEKPTTEGGSACFWIDGQPRSLWEYLVTEHGIDPADYGFGTFYEIRDVSADGSALVGWGIGGSSNRAFHVTLPRFNDKPSLESSIADGAAVHVREGEAVGLKVKASDADAGDDLTIGVTGLPAGATLTPPAGTTQAATKQAPFEATLQWTPGEADVDLPHDVTISFTDEMNAVSSLSFTIEVRSNDAPAVAPVTPVKIECIDGQHLVDLATTANDPDGDPLTATWKVAGTTVKSGSVAADGKVSYSGNFEHGANAVELLISDGVLVTTTSATVTIEDTLDPTITVTPKVELSTDKGKAFASKSRLTPPTAQDASGHPVQFGNDAPATLALGSHVVTWTATDLGGNQVVAQQTVIVRDREKPTIGAAPPVQLFCDSGKTYATNRLKKPTVKDNVPGSISLTSSAKPRFPIGTHRVVWTAKDAAGNIARKTQVVRVVNRKPKSNAGRDIVVTTRSERGANVTLNGSASSDPDRQALRYKWSASGVALKGATSAKATGRFPVGTRMAKLTVTDAGGLKSTDTVRVIVRLTNGKRRPRGSDANRSFVAATRQASQVVAEKGSRSGAALSGLAYANAASAYGDAAGECVLWEEGQAEADATLAYAQLRAVQRTYGQAAASALLSAYAETGDESLLTAYGYAAYGTAYAAADLSER